MRIVSRAPLRIDPAGGGTDAPPYSEEYGGAVVNFAIALYSYANFQWLPEGSGVTIYSRDLKQGIHAASSDELQIDGHLDFLKAFPRRFLKGRSDFLLVTESDIPIRTGLGGSGSLGVAITKAITRAMGEEHSQFELAILANEVERKDLGYAGGNQDSIGAAIGGAKKIDYKKGGGCACNPIQLSARMRGQIERDMLLIYTGGVHLSGKIHSDIKAAYDRKDASMMSAMDTLKDAAHRMAQALATDDLTGFIQALNDSRKNHYALHYSCDSDVLRKYFSELDPYILGGKTAGAGGGGYIFVYTKPGCKQRCIEVADSLGGKAKPCFLDKEGVVAWEEESFAPSEIEEIIAMAKESQIGAE